MADLSLTAEERQIQILMSMVSEGSISQFPCGPIRTLVPEKYHQYIDSNILQSLLVVSREEQQRLMESAGLASLGVIHKEPTIEVYTKVLDNLNDIGKEAVKEINPWVLNTLIDWCNFDNIICTTTASPDTQDRTSSRSDSLSQMANTDGASSSVASDAAVEYKWSTESTRYLLHLYKENRSKFESPFCKKKSVWKDIAECMEREGFKYDAIKCERKVLNLKAQFKKTKIHNHKSGSDPKTCPFYEELDEIFYKDPSIIPLSTCASLLKSQKEPAMESQTAEQQPKEDKNKKKEKPETSKEQPKKKQKKGDIIIGLLEQQQEGDRDRMDLLREIKDQQKEQTSRFLNIFEKALCGKTDNNNNCSGNESSLNEKQNE